MVMCFLRFLKHVAPVTSHKKKMYPLTYIHHGLIKCLLRQHLDSFFGLFLNPYFTTIFIWASYSSLSIVNFRHNCQPRIKASIANCRFKSALCCRCTLWTAYFVNNIVSAVYANRKCYFLILNFLYFFIDKFCKFPFTCLLISTMKNVI